MYPPVGVGQIRVAEKHDIVLGGKLHIPAGTILWVSFARFLKTLHLLKYYEILAPCNHAAVQFYEHQNKAVRPIRRFSDCHGSAEG